MSADLVAALVRALSDSPEISGWATGGIFGGFIPKDAVPPLVLVKDVARRPTTRPTTQWWDLVAVVDIHAEDPAATFDITAPIEEAVRSVAGSQPEGVFQSCDAVGITSMEDGTYTPTRFRNLVTVEATARSN